MHQRQAHYQFKVCHYLGGNKGEGVKANSDKAEGVSSIGIFMLTYFLNGPRVAFDLLRTCIILPRGERGSKGDGPIQDLNY